ARLQLTGLLRVVDHGDGDAVLDRRERIEQLELDHDFGGAVAGNAVEPYQRRVAYEIGDVVVDLSVHRLLQKTKDPNGLSGSDSNACGCRAYDTNGPLRQRQHVFMRAITLAQLGCRFAQISVTDLGHGDDDRGVG